MRRNRRW